jgi:hypothetical protein
MRPVRPLWRRALEPSVLVAALVAITGAPGALAHGGPEKVADGRIAVSLTLAPAQAGTRLLFRFRDMRTGAAVAAPLLVRVLHRDPERGVSRELAHGVRATRGILDLVHAFPAPGLHEVLIEFEREDEPSYTYRPEDWLVDIPSTDRGGLSWGSVAGLAGGLGALVAPALYLRRRQRDRFTT